MLFSIAVILIGLLNCAFSDNWTNKVDLRLLKKFDTQSSTASYLILLNSEAFSTEDVPALERPTYVFNRLSAEAERTQAPIIEYLKKANVPYQSYIVANLIVATSNISVLADVAGMDNINIIEHNNEFRVPLEEPEEIETVEEETQKRQTPVIEWNVDWVRAPSVWNEMKDPNGNVVTGLGFVVANADTGVQWEHPALREAYRGTSEAGQPNHNYNWWDSVKSGGGRCGANTKAPCDDNGHGTHTTGTAVGYAAGANNYIGVAPGAKWIACRNMNAGIGTPQTYIECLDFFIAPYDLNGANRRPDLAPHAIGNSYGCPSSEGCSKTSLSQAVANVIKAGIFMSVSAGNSGPSCYSITDPPATELDVCTVGATAQRSSTIASYSSRGPIEENVIGPSLVAPGSGVRSAYPTNTYASLSGTSMASPAITGAIPLIWQALPGYSREVTKTIELLKDSATPRNPSPNQVCDGPTSGPNNVYGNGELNVYYAIEMGGGIKK
jgi:subtilisin family serine protease